MRLLNKLLKALIPHELRVYLSRKITALPNPNIARLEKIIQDYIGRQEGVVFKGQISQDLVAYLYFNKKKNGFFVDIGANDGVTYNNTLVFEQMGWRGICAEPHPVVFKKLTENRMCITCNVAIASNAKKNVEFICDEKDDMFSGLASKLSDSARKGKSIKINCISFNDLIFQYADIRHIDFLSIDTEGCEMDILSTIDFSRYSFGLITVEGGKEEVTQFLKTKGYKIYRDLGQDIMFIPQ